MSEWWNRQTRTFEGRIPRGVRVQVPLPTPNQKTASGRGLCPENERHLLNIREVFFVLIDRENPEQQKTAPGSLFLFVFLKFCPVFRPPEEAHDLCSRAGGSRAEGGLFSAGGDAIFDCPENRVIVVILFGHVSEGVQAPRCRNRKRRWNR